MEELQKQVTPHHLILQDRNLLELTGVSDLSSFDENVVIATTSMGELTVHGHNLNVRHLDLESGLLALEGKVDSFIYSEGVQSNWLSRLLR